MEICEGCGFYHTSQGIYVSTYEKLALGQYLGKHISRINEKKFFGG